jgi:hypothetical protein
VALSARFTYGAYGYRGAEVWPGFNWIRQTVNMECR